MPNRHDLSATSHVILIRYQIRTSQDGHVCTHTHLIVRYLVLLVLNTTPARDPDLVPGRVSAPRAVVAARRLRRARVWPLPSPAAALVLSNMDGTIIVSSDEFRHHDPWHGTLSLGMDRAWRCRRPVG